MVLRLEFGGRFQNVPCPKSFPLRLLLGSWTFCHVEFLLVGDWLVEFLSVGVSFFLVSDTATDGEKNLLLAFGWAISKNACSSKSDWFRDENWLLGGLTLLDAVTGVAVARSMCCCCAIWFCNVVIWSLSWSIVCWRERNRLSPP
jgi:hypothetical protein